MDEFKNSLPVFYNDSMAGFFSQSPTTIYVYWELSAGQWQTVTGMGGLRIRLYVVCENENSEYEYSLLREIIPPPYTGGWYFEDLEPNTRYCFELGGKFPDGSFFPVVKSGVVTTPPAPRNNTMPVHTEVLSAIDGKSRVLGSFRMQPDERPESLEVSDVFESMPFYMGYLIK